MRVLALITILVSATLFASDAGLTIGNQLVNDLTMTNVRYVGQCPGFAKDKVKVKFRSQTTDTASDLRVKVENVTPGYDGDPFPYTDREYQSGSNSEKTYLMQSSKHRGMTFSVLNGLNRFEYKIYKKEKEPIDDDDDDDWDDWEMSNVVEQGSFEVMINIEEQRVVRDMVRDWEWQCYGPNFPPYRPYSLSLERNGRYPRRPYPGNRGQNCRWVPVWRCPM